MKKTIAITLFLSTILTSCAQDFQYPGQLEIRNYKIGNKVDTTEFKKVGNLYFPNYLDGWTLDNFDQLPEEYKGLPIAIWQLKSDSSIALTLLNDAILNITVSYLTEQDKNNLTKGFIEKFGIDGKEKSYEQTHPLQSWITYWNLKTWKTKEVIIQLGNSNMRKPEDSVPTEIWWNLAYSDFSIENKIIEDYKKIMFSSKEDSSEYFKQKNARNNRLNPPQNGKYTAYYEKGNIKEKGIYKNSKKEGIWMKWHENGQKEDSAYYEKGNLAKTRLMWYLNGQLELESFWGKPDNRIGKWIKWYTNGQIESITNFNEKGELHGKHFQYFENGNLKREVTYENEKELEDKLWNSEGKRIK